MPLFGTNGTIHMHNILSCEGFKGAGGVDLGGIGGLNFGECMQAKLFGVILFFVIALVNKWGGEEMGIDFNMWAAYAGGLISYLVVVTIIGMPKISFIIGLVIALILGYGGGAIFGGTDSGGDYG